MNKVMLAFTGAAAATLMGGAAFAQASSARPDTSAVPATVGPLQGDDAVTAAQREGGSGMMGSLPTPSTTGSSTNAPGSSASSAGQYSSDTAATAPSTSSKKKSGAKADDKASTSSGSGTVGAGGSTGAASSGSSNY